MIIQSIILHITHTLECEIGIYLPENNELRLQATSNNYAQVTSEIAIANWVFQSGKSAGYQTDYHSDNDNAYFPLKTAQSIVGVMSIQFDDHSTAINPQQLQLIYAFANQSALAIEATRLAEQKHQTEILREKERLPPALLNSISHDLRTPLVSITGALSSLRENSEYFDPETRRELLDGAWEDADRLNRLVGNLLDMTRLEAGTIRLKIELYDLQEIIGVARGQLKLLLQNREVKIDIPSDLPLIPVDFVLIVQVIVNLLDNAVKYSRPNGAIGIKALIENQHMRIEIVDEGIGIPEDELQHIFKRFHRATKNNNVSGTGLGLSICEGIIEAHNGKIWAENRIEGGTRFILLLPLTT
jgi:two-component system sensor histidine kinase KdpD